MLATSDNAQKKYKFIIIIILLQACLRAALMQVLQPPETTDYVNNYNYCRFYNIMLQMCWFGGVWRWAGGEGRFGSCRRTRGRRGPGSGGRGGGGRSWGPGSGGRGGGGRRRGRSRPAGNHKCHEYTNNTVWGAGESATAFCFSLLGLTVQCTQHQQI